MADGESAESAGEQLLASPRVSARRDNRIWGRRDRENDKTPDFSGFSVHRGDEAPVELFIAGVRDIDRPVLLKLCGDGNVA